MNKSKSSPFIGALAGLWLLSSPLYSQIFYNNGATVFISNGGLVQANGGAENANSGQLTNHGDYHINNLGTPNSGSLTLSSASTAQGNGKYYIEQDFINKATFTANNSEVLMNSTVSNQQITGSQVTTFHKLTLVSQNNNTVLPKVLMTINANVDSLLTLNDRELGTDVNTMFILNPDPNAVTNYTAVTTPGTEGFVSSLAPGTLSRVSNATSAYLYPVGSSTNNLKRYRPVKITPTANAGSTYTARFVNHDADVDNYLRSTNDGVFCFANDTFYHAINRSAGTDPADVSIHYLASADGSWANMAQWRTTNNKWNDMNTVNAGPNAGVYSSLVRPAWAFANPGEPYVLTNLNPTRPTISCPTSVCNNNPAATFTASSSASNATYNWATPAGSTLVSGQGTGTANVNWNSPGQYIHVSSQIILYGHTCVSQFSDSCTVTVVAAPVANFSAAADPGNNFNYSFTDLTAPAASSWSWNFGDGYTSATQNPSHLYTIPGTHQVVLTASANGCTDMDTLTILVDYKDILVIPNVFTPDGDGINDELFVTHNGLKDFSITVYNRWGQKMYSSTGSNFHWDGKDTQGQYVSDGTYYYLVKATSLADKIYDVKGYLYVFRK